MLSKAWKAAREPWPCGLASWLLILLWPTSLFAAGASEYSGHLLSAEQRSWSLLSQIDVVHERSIVMFSPDIQIGLGGGFEALSVGAARRDLNGEDFLLDSLTLLLRFQLFDGFAAGAGPIIPLEESADLEALSALYLSRDLSPSVSFTANLCLQLNSVNTDLSSWWGVLTVEYELPGGTRIYSELDGARTWQDDPENLGATFVGADFQLGEQDTLNFFLTTSILGDPAPLETWGLGLIYSRGWSDAPLTP
jgi:hypothetical protein